MIGKIFGERYEIREPLGRGGMGQVYLARDRQDGQPVALKVMEAMPGDDGLLLRFRREILVMSRLDHPNVVRILDEGEEAGQPFLVMELLRGQTIDEAFRTDEEQERIQPERLERIIRAGLQVTAALGYLHHQGIYHRDVKPGNIMVLPDGQVKLLDFGLARLIDRTRMTLTTELLGSVQYLSPEAVAQEQVDGRSDLYSLGVVLYELLTGSSPFPTESLFATLMQIHHEPPPPPRSLVQGLPATLDASILRLLAKDPSDRYQTAEELEAVLKSWRLSESRAAPETPRSGRVGPFLLQPVFVGRHGPLARIRELALREDRGVDLVVVSGLAGIGKSRLMAETARSLQGLGFLALSGEYGRMEPSPLPLYRRLLDQATAFLAGESEESRNRILGADGPVLARLGGGLAALLQDQEPPTSSGILLALSGFLGRLARVRPLLLLLDDLQWAGSQGLEHWTALLRSSRRLSAPRPLWLCGVPGEERGSGSSLDLLLEEEIRSDRAIWMDLAPLSRIEATELLGSLVGGDELDSRLLEALLTGCEGNPFLLRESLGGWMEADLLVQGPSGWTWRHEGMAPPVPESVVVAVEQRLVGLHRRTRRVLVAAAAVGREQSYSILSRILDMDRDELLQRLDQLIRRRLLLEEDGRDGPRLRFTQEKVREVVYSGAPSRRRRKLHGEIARALEELHQEDPARMAAELADHFGRGGLPEKALCYHRLAAETARKDYSLDRAVDHLNQAEECLQQMEPEPPEVIPEILADRAGLLQALGRQEEALEDAHRLVQEGEERRDSVLKARGKCLEGSILRGLGRLEEAVQELKSAELLAQIAGAHQEVARALQIRAVTERHRGNGVAARELALRAEELFRQLGDPVGEARALGTRAITLILGGSSSEAIPLLESALERYLEAEDWSGVAATLTNLGNLRLEQGNPRAALEHYSEALSVERRAGSPARLGRLTANLGHLFLGQGDPDRAMGHLEEARDLFLLVNDRPGLGGVLSSLAVVAKLQQRLGEALVLAREAIRILAEVGDRRRESSTRMTIAEILLLQGKVEDCREDLRAAQEMAQAIGDQQVLAEILLLQTQVESIQGHPEAVRRIGKKALQAVQAAELHSLEWRIQALMARSARELGDLDRAEEEAREAQLALWDLYDRLTDVSARRRFREQQEIRTFLEETGFELPAD